MISLLSSTEKHTLDTAPKCDTYRVELPGGVLPKNVALWYKRTGAGLFAPAPFAAELWTDDATNVSGLYAEFGLTFEDRTLADFDGGYFLSPTVCRVLRHLGLTVSDDFLSRPLAPSAAPRITEEATR